MTAVNFNFVSKNVKGLHSSKKGLKVFEHLKNKIVPNGILFLQENHSLTSSENKWSGEFSGGVYFSHGKTNSCGVLTTFYGNLEISIPKKLADTNGRILVLDVTINESNYILINFYNANSESERLKTFEILNNMLSEFTIDSIKHITFTGDFNFFFFLTQL